MSKQGFTFVELAMIMGMMAVLFTVSSISLLNSRSKASQTSTLNVLLSDIQEQQAKAMLGDTEGRPTTSVYGVYFENSRYTLFHGSAYSASDPTNFVTNLETNLNLTNTFVNSQIIFSQISGEINGYVAGQDSFTLRDSSNGEQKTVTFNRYGVIININ